MRLLFSMVLICFGGYIFTFAFRKNAKGLEAAAIGSALLFLGFAILPGGTSLPDVYHRK